MGMALNSPNIDQRNGPIPKLNDVDVGAPRNIRSLLVAMPFVPSSFLLLVVRPGAPRSVLVPFVAMPLFLEASLFLVPGNVDVAPSQDCWYF